MREIVIISVYV